MRAWATLCSPYADNDQGLQIMPEVGSEVVVAFGAGLFEWPYIVGSVWNGKETAAATPEQANNIRLLRTRADSRLEFDDTARRREGHASPSQSGHKVVLDDAAPGDHDPARRRAASSRLDALDIEINANVELDVTAPMVKVDAAMSTFSGIVEGKTLIADAFVLSPGYSPGVGNLL